MGTCIGVALDESEDQSVSVLVDGGIALGAVASVATVMAVGAGAGERFKTWRTLKKAGPVADHDLLHKLNDDFHIAMEGRPKSAADPSPPPGVNGRLENLEKGVEQIRVMLTQNGGNSTDPGDMLKKLLDAQETLIENQNALLEQANITPKKT